MDSLVLTGLRQCRDDSLRLGLLVDDTGVDRHSSGRRFQSPTHVRGVDEWQYIGVRKRSVNSLLMTCIAARLFVFAPSNSVARQERWVPVARHASAVDTDLAQLAQPFDQQPTRSGKSAPALPHGRGRSEISENWSTSWQISCRS